ncbi:MAG: type I restriction-modification system subunit M N-terminal domain-containing protein, partial [Oligoflexia bacterium]|nr:type I restriction-modification system subunit M N-terminal domain-containing protein [Oligoflexia bacterium]
MLEAGLKSKIDKLWDLFWSGGIANPLTAIDQISYLLFMKKLDDQDIKNKKSAKFVGKSYRSIFQNNKELCWSHWKHFSAEQMLN